MPETILGLIGHGVRSVVDREFEVGEIADAVERLRLDPELLRAASPSPTRVATVTLVEFEALHDALDDARLSGGTWQPSVPAPTAPSRSRLAVAWLLGGLWAALVTVVTALAHVALTGEVSWVRLDDTWSAIAAFGLLALIAGVVLAALRKVSQGALRPSGATVLLASLVGGVLPALVLVWTTWLPAWGLVGPLQNVVGTGVAGAVVLVAVGVIACAVEVIVEEVGRAARTAWIVIAVALVPWAVALAKGLARGDETMPSSWALTLCLCVTGLAIVVGAAVGRAQANRVTRLSRGGGRQTSIEWRLGSSSSARQLSFTERTTLEDRVEQTYLDWLGAVRDKAVMPALRTAVNAASKPPHSTELVLHDASGLHNLGVSEFLVDTGTFAKVERLLRGISGGAVGIAGPRGAGKMTILDATATGGIAIGDRPPPLVIRESVPVKYEARDFVLHLYARLCTEFIEVAESAPPARGGGLRWTARKTAVVGVFIAVAGAVVAGLSGALDGNKPPPTWVSEVVVFGFGVAIGAVVFPIDPFRQRHKAATTLSEVAESARRRLSAIKYQQRFGSGWSGRLAFPAAGDISGSKSHDLTEVVRSYPEIVHDFRGFLREVLAVLDDDDRRDRVNVLFVIDELDKMSSWSNAELFINEIKSVFVIDQPGCLYLVSASEEALNSFEQEGLAVRDAFNSAFDEIIRVDYLTLADSQKLLRSRVIGMPAAFECACHCLSGGLPRELLRVARGLVGDVEATETNKLGGLVRAKMTDELRERLHGLRSALRGIATEEQEAAATLLVALQGLMAKEVTSDSVLESARAAAESGAEPPSSKGGSFEQVRLGVAAHLYYAATVLEVFDDGLDEKTVVAISDPVGAQSIERLTAARVQIGFNPRWSWATTSSFRGARSMTVVELPSSNAIESG